MKIKELIEKLKEYDEKLDVYCEGCDCINPALNIGLYGKDGIILNIT